jgi:hypothetical protein
MSDPLETLILTTKFPKTVCTRGQVRFPISFFSRFMGRSSILLTLDLCDHPLACEKKLAKQSF